MRYLRQAFLWLAAYSASIQAAENPTSQIPLTGSLSGTDRNISTELFADLEELSRIVDISYCVGATGTGIQKPFLCASRCQDFPDFELVTVCNSTITWIRLLLLTGDSRHGIQEFFYLTAVDTLLCPTLHHFAALS